MGKTSEKTSTWLALRNPIFRRLWLAMVVSGSCIGGAELAGCLNSAYRIDGHGFGTSLHPVHLTRGCYRRYCRPPKDFIMGSTMACHHRFRTGDFMDRASSLSL